MKKAMLYVEFAFIAALMMVGVIAALSTLLG